MIEAKKVKEKKIGIEVPRPSRTCDDKNCPWHGKKQRRIKIRGRQFVGTVVRVSSPKTVLISWPRLFYLPKYERYEKRRTRLFAHASPCLDINLGDKARLVECRPISKTKNFIIIEKIGGEQEVKHTKKK